MQSPHTPLRSPRRQPHPREHRSSQRRGRSPRKRPFKLLCIAISLVTQSHCNAKLSVADHATDKKCSGCTKDAVGSQSEGRRATSQQQSPSLTPSMPGPSNTLPETTTPAASKAAVVPIIDLTADVSEPTTPSSVARALPQVDPSGRSAVAMVESSRTTGSTANITERVGLVTRRKSEVPGHTARAEVKVEQATEALAIRSGTPDTLRGPNIRSTPLFIRQLREAAGTPNAGLGQRKSTSLEAETLAASSVRPTTTPKPPGVEGVIAQESVRSEAGPKEQFEPVSSVAVGAGSSSCAASAAQSCVEDAAPGLHLTTTLPRLVASTEGYDEFVITTTYRVAKNNLFGPPQISVIFPPCEPRVRVSERARQPQPSTNHKRHPAFASTDISVTEEQRSESQREYLEDGEFKYRKGSRRKPARGRTPKPFHRGEPFHRLSPSRLKTPVRQATPRRSATPGCLPVPTASTPRERPAVGKSTTIRRRDQWKKVMANTADYSRRRTLFPRRLIFQQPVQERDITLSRLEIFWKIMADLIAEKKLFHRGVYDHWENVSTCTRLVNARLAEKDAFGLEESCAVARELMRQRMVMLTGGDKLMLTRNALSTRLS